MVGKCLEYSDGVGRIICSATEMVYPFVSADVTGDLAKGDMADFQPNGKIGTEAAAVSITKRSS